MAKKSTEIVPTMLRIREELRRRLEREAKKRDHSLNAEMVERLEQSFVRDEKSLRDTAILDALIGNRELIELLRRATSSFWGSSATWPSVRTRLEELAKVIGQHVDEKLAQNDSVIAEPKDEK
jgi:hypothetical protein